MDKNKTFTTASGAVLPLCQVSQIDLIPLEALFADGAPLPPLEEVDTADGKKMLPNPVRKDYKEKLDRYQARRGVYGIASVIELGVELELTDEQLSKVARAKKKMAVIYPDSVNDLENKFNVFLYVKSICPTMDELNRLVGAIVELNTPTAVEVQQHLDAFRPGISGSGDNVDQDAAIWDSLALG